MSVLCYFWTGYESPYYNGLNLVIIGLGVLIPWPFYLSLITTLIIYFTYLIPMSFHPSATWPLVVTNHYFILATSLIAVTGSYLQYLVRLREFSARDQLEEMDRIKSRFFSNLTHEFRTPLVSLSTALQSLRDKSRDPEIEVLLSNSHTALEDMLENIGDLLTKTRSEKGMLEMRWYLVDIVPFVEKVVASFQVIAKKQGNQLSFVNRLGESINPPVSPFFSTGIPFGHKGGMKSRFGCDSVKVLLALHRLGSHLFSFVLFLPIVYYS